MPLCFLGIGSNLGDRRGSIAEALRHIAQLEKTKILKVSSLRQTLPQGGPRKQRKFLNACLKINTQLSPHRLRKELKTIEEELGRTPTVRWGPRRIDIDILFYGTRTLRTKSLIIPHPRLFQRDFVLHPLKELLCG
ncbi:MAG: 2-amino-4-hydroxy-6-hydroxymethyldihydropteridine diphosphokinase [Candidatus Omnitrophica bacterium]|nr:2-amino-4-hydroxy-6-hydroxymethyldihydropteridine diphosphokinase [Candidatus Omnitrophota bacterium]